MSKSYLSLAAVIVAVAGVLIAVKSFWSAPTLASTRTVAAVAAYPVQTQMRPIVPAPVVDPKAEIFVGTGDGASGAWLVGP